MVCGNGCVMVSYGHLTSYDIHEEKDLHSNWIHISRHFLGHCFMRSIRSV